ncbi:MAG: photosynthetic complex putative assembly protein PuhB [Pseudomonadota bacterium]
MKETTHEFEHEFEAAHGLPEPLPARETLLWQGTPDVWAMARDVFHTRSVALYFGVILALRAASAWSDTGSAYEAALAVVYLLPLAVLGLGLLALLAWLTARTTVYTLTDQRVVMRIGIVLTLTFNLPFKAIAAADLRQRAGGSGDIPLTLAAGEKIAFAHLWPHARPWRVATPVPMLRNVPDAARVAQLLAQAWSQSRGVALTHSTALDTPETGHAVAAHSHLSPT